MNHLKMITKGEKTMSQLKNKTILVVLTILIIGTLTACAEDTTIEDYLELEAAFFALNNAREFTLTAEVRFELLGVEGAVAYMTSTHTRADGINEFFETQSFRDQNGAHIWKTEVITTREGVFMDIDSELPFILSEYFSLEGDAEILEFLGISFDFDNVSPADVFGGPYTHFRLHDDTFQELIEEWQEWRDLWTGLYGAFTEEGLESYLSRSDGVFRIEVESEAIEPYIEAVLDEFQLVNFSIVLTPLLMIADIDDSLMRELEYDFDNWVLGADLTDAWFVIERAKLEEDTYWQKIEFYIPERVFITVDVTIVASESTPVEVPNRFFLEGELAERLDVWLIEQILASMPDGERNPALIGTWAWNYSDSYEYVFEAGGRASRGFIGAEYFFAWSTTYDGVLIISWGPIYERWLYTIDGNVLTISSLDTPGMEFSYIRVEESRDQMI